MKLGRAIGSAMLAVPLALAGCGSPREEMNGNGKVHAAESMMTHEAKYTEDGALVRPRNWREWIFVGMPVTPTALNDGKAVLPEAQAIYIDPTSWKHWKETGTFRDGTMFAVELTLLMSHEAHADGSTNQLTGRGFFQDEFSGLQFAIKDSGRFADEPGNWAYFSTPIGATENDYPDTMTAFPTEACNSCHQSNGGQDWVVYPVLSCPEGCEAHEERLGGVLGQRNQTVTWSRDRVIDHHSQAIAELDVVDSLSCRSSV